MSLTVGANQKKLRFKQGKSGKVWEFRLEKKESRLVSGSASAVSGSASAVSGSASAVSESAIAVSESAAMLESCLCRGSPERDEKNFIHYFLEV